MKVLFTKKLRSHRLLMLLLLILAPLQDGCGTIVGNPKKPPPTNENVNPVVYSLPLIDFSVPESAVSETDSESVGLNLAGTSVQKLSLQKGGEGAGQKTVLVAWAKRLERTILQINRLAARINKIVESERTVNKDDVLIFKAKGHDNQLGAKIQQLPAGNEYKFEAVLCHNSAVVSHVRWTEDGSKMEVSRNFAAQVEQEDAPVSLVSRLVVEKGAAVSIDLMTYGTSSGDLPDEAGKGFVEHAVISRKENAEITVKSVTGLFAEEPADLQYNGAYYLTGRMTPDAKTGDKPYVQQFVAYYQGYKLLCKNGFDEDAADLWHPAAASPGFCLGRPAGQKKFDSFQNFADTVADLEGVGIVSRKTLAPVVLSPELGCE